MVTLMVNLLRFSILSWAAMALSAVAGCAGCAGCSAFADEPAKEKSKARARAALALVTVESPLVAADPPVAAARAAAKAALKACGESCACVKCDCDVCDCCAGETIPAPKAVPKSMPPAALPGATVEKLSFAELRKAAESLKPGESIRAYAGQAAPANVTGRVVVLTDAIPNEEQRIGVWKCWRDGGEPMMESCQPASGAVRVVVNGRYFDRYTGGELYWCVACNRGK